MPSLCKSIPGHSWSKTKKAWTYPLSIQTCQILREVFGKDLEIGETLWKWAAEKNKVDAKLKDLGSAMDGNLDLVKKIAPKMYEAMGSRTYQRSGARFLADRRQALDLDDLGLGKTVTALAAIMETGTWNNGSHIVVAPSTALRPTWANQVKRWTDGTPFVPEGSADRRHKIIAEYFDAEGPKILIVNPEMLRAKVKQYCPKCKTFDDDRVQFSDEYYRHHDEAHKSVWKMESCAFPELLEHEWDSIVADECDYLIPIRPASKKPMTQQCEGLVRLRSKPNGLRVPMTGTPFHGRERNIFGLLCWARPQDYRGYWSWVDTYFEVDRNGFGVDIKGLREDRKDKFFHDLDVNCLRRTRQEVRSDLPVNNRIDVWVEMLPRQKAAYKRWIDEGSFTGAEGAYESIGILSELTRARQFAFGLWEPGPRAGKLVPIASESPKLDCLMGMLRERGIHEQPISTAVDKIIVASQFTEIINMIHDYLEKSGIPSLRITGSHKKTSDGRLAADVFNEPGGPRVLLLNTDAGGTSLTLDEYCDELVFLDEKFVDDDQKQVMGRIDNRGGRVAVKNFYFIRTEGTVEEGIALSNMSQEQIQRALLDGRRGVEFLVNLLNGSK